MYEGNFKLLHPVLDNSHALRHRPGVVKEGAIYSRGRVGEQCNGSEREEFE